MKGKILILSAVLITFALNMVCFVLNRNYIIGRMERNVNIDLSCFAYHFIIGVVMFFGTLIYAGTKLKIRGIRLTKLSVYLTFWELVVHFTGFGIYGWLSKPQGIADSCFVVSGFLSVGTIGFIFLMSIIIYIWEKQPVKKLKG